MSGDATSAARLWSVVLASREVWPFVEGGGIGRYMWAAARFLAPHAEVSILTSSDWKPQYEELVRNGDDRLPDGVRFAFADEPRGDLSPFVSWSHVWSLRLLEGAAKLYPDGGPDILEMADYQAEAFAAAHARRGLDPRLRDTRLAVGLHTSAEMCAVLDQQPEDAHMRLLGGLERFALRFADAVLWPSENTLERYEQFYGTDALAPGIQRSLPPPADVPLPAPLEDTPGSGPLRLLYLNRLQSLKGIAQLVTAVRSLPDANLTLTVAGRDTITGPGGLSMRSHLEELAAGDARIEFVGEVPHSDVSALIASHHIVVVPSRWEAFSYVVREALAGNRPVLATPVGGIVDVVRPGQSGWLARSSEADDLAEALRHVLAASREIAAMIAEGRPRAAFEEDARDEKRLAAYRELLERRGVSNRREAALRTSVKPDIDALVICDASGGDPLPTLLSLEEQVDVSVHPVLAVGDSGSFPGPGPALARAAVALASGVSHATADLVLVIAAGAVVHPSFLRRASDALADEPRIAWVTSLTRFGTKPTDAPLGSYALPAAEVAVTTAMALMRRSALERALGDSGSAAAAGLFARLAAVGAHGLVLQEELIVNLPRRAA